MITIRKASERGHANYGLLDSFHSFSFAEYYDPENMGFSALRVINDDTVDPGAGFPTHPHRNMEILSYVLEGSLEHKDSMGNGSVIHAGEIQRMTAGKGLTHSEFNASESQPVRLLQIWILPDRTGLEPSYEQKRIDREKQNGQLCLVASGDGRENSITINQDASIYSTILDGNQSVTHKLANGRKTYVHVARGNVQLNSTLLSEGDGARIEAENVVHLHGIDNGEVLLFDLPGQ